MSKKLTEFQIIEKFFKPLTNGNEASRDLADDVAEISLKRGQKLVISKDLMVENVHFLLSDGGFKIASKLLRSNLSDIASSGATPHHYMLGFSKNSAIDENFIKEFSRGLQDVQNEFNVSLIGGDTVSGKELFFSITIFGVVEKNQILSRNQAKLGDLIFVSGSIGDAYLGLKSNDKNNNLSLNASDKKYLLNRHFFPTPRIELGKKLIHHNLSKCAIDVSDGLLADLLHICKSSELGAKIYQNQIPFSASAKKILKKNPIIFSDLISGGDDYELIFTSDKKNYEKIIALSKILKTDLTCIGEVCRPTYKKNPITLLDRNNKKIKIKKYGYEH